MKIFLLAFTFLALFSFNANAGDGGCKRFNLYSGSGKDHQDGLSCFVHHHTSYEHKGLSFKSETNNGDVNLVYLENYLFPSKKKLKKQISTMRHIMTIEKNRCLMRDNKNAYLFLNLDKYNKKNALTQSASSIKSTMAYVHHQKMSSLYVICGKDEFKAMEHFNNIIYLCKKKDGCIKYPTHFYKNAYIPSAIYEIDLNKSKAIRDKSAKKEKAKKLQPLKDDCKDLGFTENTEAMGNCILKLMELKQSTNSSGQSQSSDDTSVSEWLGIANDGINMMNDNSSSSQTCFKTGEVKQAFNKICEYKCGLTTYTTNLGTGVGLCPSTIQR